MLRTGYWVLEIEFPVKKNTYLLHCGSFGMLFFLLISKRNLYFISCFDLVINEIDKLFIAEGVSPNALE